MARLAAVLARPERWHLAGLGALLGATLALQLVAPALLGRLVDAALAGDPAGSLVTVALGYLGVTGLAELGGLAVTWGTVHVSWRAGNRLRGMLARRALAQDLAWHGGHSPGQLIERIDGDAEAIATFGTDAFVHVAGNAVLVAGMLGVAWFIHPAAGVVLAVAAAAGTWVMYRLRRAAVPAREAERAAAADLYGDLEERLGGLEDLRANGAGGWAVDRLERHSARLWRLSRRAAATGDGAYAAAAATFAVGSAATIAVGFLLVDAGAVTVGQVVALWRYSTLLSEPLERIAEQLKELQRAVAAARRASRMLAERPRIRPGSEPAAVVGPRPPAVELTGVRFAYASGAAPALEVDRLVIPPGRHLGVVGRTGSGKTTLGRLVARLWDPDTGTVRIGGVDIRRLSPDALRATVAVVSQDVELFDATVRDNLTVFGVRPASDDRLAGVLREVGLAAWLARQPLGLDTPVGDLSAGEAQLLAAARALLADPAVVVLDEASSRLDPATAARFAAACTRLLAGRTAVVIAHRLETIDGVDDVAVVEAGRVVEHGPRARLAADPSSRFAAMLAAAGRPTGVPGP